VSDRLDEEYLVLRAQAGSNKAFDILYRSYNPSLIRFSYRLCHNEQLALDAVQDAWITITRTFASLANPAMFRSRVFKAVRWRTIDQMRKRENNMIALDDSLAADNLSEENPWATSNQIATLVRKLPEVEKQCVYLFYLEEMTLKEISAVFDVPTGTVKSRLNRARKRLRKIIEEEDNADD